jgi:hypothetical protein
MKASEIILKFPGLKIPLRVKVRSKTVEIAGQK